MSRLHGRLTDGARHENRKWSPTASYPYFHTSPSPQCSHEYADVGRHSRYRIYGWNDRNTALRDGQPGVWSSPQLSFRGAVRSDLCAMARALRLRNGYCERHHRQPPALARGRVICRILQGRDGSRVVIATIRPRSLHGAERRLFRRFEARSLVETPASGPWRSTVQTDSNHTGADEGPVSAGSSDGSAEDQESVSVVEEGYVEYGPDGYSGGAFQMTVSEEESERADSVEASASLDPLGRERVDGQPEVVFHEADSSLASRSMRRLWVHRRRPFWLGRNNRWTPQ